MIANFNQVCSVLSRFRALCVVLGVLIGGHAQATQCKLDPDGSIASLAGPANLVVPASTSDGTVLWRSGPQTTRMQCITDSVYWSVESVFLWLNPARKTLADGVVVGLVFNGVTYIDELQAPATKIRTGFEAAKNWTPITLNYEVLFIKRGAAPQSGTSNINFDLFQPDGEGGLNTSPNARTVRVNVTGRVSFSQGGTCQVSAGDLNRTVALPTVNTSAMSNIGDSAGATRFSINVANCTQAVRSVRFIFEGTGAGANPRYFSNTGTASGVAMRLSTAAGQLVEPRAPFNESTANVAGSQSRLDMVADYVRTGTVMPGTMVSRATVSLIYQ